MQYKAAKAFILKKLKEELSPELTYHGIHHTLEVLEMVEEIALFEGGISDYDLELLKIAALYHDSGFTEGMDNHEMRGVDICNRHLPEFGYEEKEIELISGMIMATKIPQSPKNNLERIICDADLDYLGREDFYSIGNTLYEELRSFGVIKTKNEWNKIQVSFLTKHAYHTETNIVRRTSKKQAYLQELRVGLPDF